MRRGIGFTLAFSALLLVTRGVVSAQSETGFQFNLSTPGARSLAMGGAFLGLADDATAAYTNPAGLTNLTVGGSEVAVEMRLWSFSTRFPKRGSFDGAPSGIGMDTVSGFEVGEASTDTSGLSFLSFGYVLPRGWTAAIYRHQLAKFETESLTEGFFFDYGECDGQEIPCLPEAARGRFRIPPLSLRHELQIENTGLSLAYQFEPSRFKNRKHLLSVGLGVSYYQYDQLSSTKSFDIEPAVGVGFLDRATGGHFGPADTLDDNVGLSIIQQGDDGAFGLNLGFLWKIGPQQRWSLGGVYRQGPDFEILTRTFSGPKYVQENEDGPVTRPPVGTELLRARGKSHVPDVYGLGIAYSGKDGKLKIALDVDQIGYSARLRDLVGSKTEDYKLEDATEVHLGIESEMFTLNSLIGTLRLGAWHEPAHELEYVGEDASGRIAFPPGKDDLHWSGGIGLVIKEDFQIDAAIDLSDRVDTVSFSIVRFF